MRPTFKLRLDILPDAQRAMWRHLAVAPELGFVLYGGTAIALHLGHRQSIDFDFFQGGALDKDLIRERFTIPQKALILQDARDTLVIVADHGAGPVKLSFFGGIAFGRVDDPLWTDDGVLLVASLDDLMATKLKATQDRAEAKDYRDIAAMIASGVSLAAGLGAVRRMFGGEPAQVLRALGYFKDGDLADLGDIDRAILKEAINGVDALPDVEIRPGLLPEP